MEAEFKAFEFITECFGSPSGLRFPNRDVFSRDFAALNSACLLAPWCRELPMIPITIPSELMLAVFRKLTLAGMYKIFRPAVGEVLREMPLAELKSKYRKVSSIEKANKGWVEEYEVSAEQASGL
ncbi:hypothetical protein MA16_Dca008063 [Dendrobium catenatum]|uniref:SBNO alpha/beta domain-containing protein n=1 Tax=Dendrobium catenatum TaxID=906689 RepID=A0A2I0WCV4_9ASPA|nr:hypothetical protein MA16_Dca008063 [Dendrobium catenatum]